jgi:hypothetical protein
MCVCLCLSFTHLPALGTTLLQLKGPRGGSRPDFGTIRIHLHRLPSHHIFVLHIPVVVCQFEFKLQPITCCRKDAQTQEPEKEPQSRHPLYLGLK